MKKLDIDGLDVHSFEPHPSPPADAGLQDMNQPPSNGCTVICTLYTMPC